MKGLEGKNVLVTGGGSGIGQAIAVRFGQEGANVAVNYLSQLNEAEETEGMIRSVQTGEVKVSLIQGDISKEEDVVRVIETTIDELGELDILINNAGILIPGESHKLNMADFDKVINVNLRGAFMCAREAIRHFLSENKLGVIINISSVHQIIPKPKFIAYSISKGGIQNLTRTLALEYADRGIRVNAIAPGATITPMNRAWADDPVKRAEVESHIPMGRAGTAEEIAAAAAFLCSDEATYITGQTLYVDGGLTLYPEFRRSWSSDQRSGISHHEA